MHSGRILLAEFIVRDGLFLAIVVELLAAFKPFFVISIGSFLNTRFVLIRAHDDLVPDIRVWALAAKAFITLSELPTGTTG